MPASHKSNYIVAKVYPSEYICSVYSIEKTEVFDKWLRKLKDQRAKAKILFRIQRIEENGNFGDCEPVGQGLFELRIHYAKGYRVYLKEYKGTVVLLLNGELNLLNRRI